MLKLETIEELESKVVKALELIQDLRSENSRLESENETLRAENDQMKLALEEKERELRSVRTQLQEANDLLNGIKEREEKLESKVNNLLGRLDSLGPSPKPSEVAPPQGKVSEPTSSQPAPDPGNSPATSAKDTELSQVVNRVPTFSASSLEDEDEIILLDEEEPEVAPETIEVSANDSVPAPALEDADIPLVDLDEDDDIIIDDEDEDITVFDSDDDDDFLIIEDDPK